MKKIVIPIIAVIIISIIVVFWFNLKGPARYAGPIEKITIADAAQPVFVLLYIAEAKGYLADEGLEVTYKSFTSGRDALTSVVNGESDIATVYETPVVLRTLEGEKLGVITELHNSTRNTALIARRDKGISVPADLKGKTIAVSKNTNGEFFLFLFLISKGIRLTDVTFVDTMPQDMVKALKEGTIDAVATWNPNLFNVKKAFTPNEIVTFLSNEYTECSVLAGKSAFVKGRPEAMKRLLRGLVRAEAHLQETEEVFTILLNRLSGQSEDTIRGVWGYFNSELRLSNILLTVLTEEAHWFIDNGRAKGPLPAFREVLFIDYLKEVKPGAVTVF